MKKILVILFLFSFHFAYAGTGSANDVMLFYLAIIGLLAMPLLIYFSIKLIRKIVKIRKEKKAEKAIDQPDDTSYESPQL